MQCQSNLRWGFRKILCPSQNIWTLNSLIALSSWWCSRPDQLFSHAYGFKVNQNCMKKVEPNPTKWAFFCTIFNWNKKQMVLLQAITQWDQRISEGAFLFLWFFFINYYHNMNFSWINRQNTCAWKYIWPIVYSLEQNLKR